MRPRQTKALEPGHDAAANTPADESNRPLRTAVLLTIAGAVLQTALALVHVPQMTGSPANRTVGAALYVAPVGLWAWSAAAIHQGRRWPRYAAVPFLAYWSVAGAATAYGTLLLDKAGWLTPGALALAALTLLVWLAGASATVLLWTGAVRARRSADRTGDRHGGAGADPNRLGAPADTSQHERPRLPEEPWSVVPEKGRH